MTDIFTVQLKRILIILFVIASPGFAEQKKDDFFSGQKHFISDLYKEKRYFDCIAETQRLLFYQNDSKYKNELLYFINACYFYSDQYKTVISRLISADDLNKDKFYLANLFMLSNSYYNLGNYEISKAVLDKPGYQETDKDKQDKLFLNRVEVLIRKYEYHDILKETDIASKYFSIINNSALRDFRRDIEGYREIGLRSRWLSASLSALLPGAGQIYSGRTMEGILSFAAVAGTACGAYYFYNKKEKPLFITLTLFSGLFYAGNIYGAYNSAINKNIELNTKFSERITQKYNLHYDPMDYYYSDDFDPGNY